MTQDSRVSLNIQFDIQAQKIVSMIMLDNKQVEEDIREGIEKAFKEFDFKKAVYESAKKEIARCVADQFYSYNSPFKKNVENQIEKISKVLVDEYLPLSRP